MIKNQDLKKKVAEAKKAAIEVLVHNFKLNVPGDELPRTAGWGYPEPYTRDLMIAALGILVTDKDDYEDEGNYEKMIKGLRIVLETLAQNQTKRGHIPSIVDDKENLGASDTTPLFILTVFFFRQITGEKDFLKKAVKKAMTWMEYQSPDDSGLVAHLHTTDWRDELWGFHGYCLFVNNIVYSYLRLFGMFKRAKMIQKKLNSPLFISEQPVNATDSNQRFYEMCVFKSYHTSPKLGKWFCLLGNSLTILSGIASPGMAKKIISYVKSRCEEMKANGDLALDVPPNLFPFVQKTDWEWRPRYELHCRPGNYLNGGIWPFICGFYVAALVAAGETELAEQELAAFTDLVKLIREPREADFSFGFNEWIKAQTGEPKGQNWQTWSAAMYVYAVKCVETNGTPFFDKIRGHSFLPQGAPCEQA